MLELVKRALRVTASAYDDEINSLIFAARADIYNCGIRETPKCAALINHAVVLYCKSNFGYQDDSEKYAEAYEHLKCSLALSSGGDRKNEL